MTDRKPDASSQPSFAEFLRDFDAKFRSGNSVPITRSSITRQEYDSFLACIREQQAALEEVVRIAEVHVQPGYLERARAVLARWRIE